MIYCFAAVEFVQHLYLAGCAVVSRIAVDSTMLLAAVHSELTSSAFSLLSLLLSSVRDTIYQQRGKVRSLHTAE